MGWVVMVRQSLQTQRQRERILMGSLERTSVMMSLGRSDMVVAVVCGGGLVWWWGFVFQLEFSPMPHISVVLDAHKEGLEVFASDFANDVPFAYNFSYNPVAEYLSFIDNGNFSVDGVLSDFLITPSAAIACFSHRGRNVSGQEKPLVISSKGSSGDYPGCTDLAYQRAISDGVDVLDCPVQMTKDGIPVCLGSINFIDYTKVAQSSFSNLTTTISELGVVNGIFPFSLTWSQIQSFDSKSSVFPDSDAYLTGMTDVVQKLHAFKIPVFVKLFRNEFISQAWDFCSDAIVEINSLVMGAEIDGVITEFPGTAAKYKNEDEV
ncbi:Glycerophosphodiester phosphodiesterase GDPDL1 [Camellia lanceoleosa]|uniref:Glycerophosphodiester phosphodiesterase GDPDL1 n=1 Tax=Camellia lanceoleosa TaxID=1840588 RepID=A0ACC0HBE5_9ERIC|nr:Glycerophosphodiester phosphodiesterase GDPDL1 [Camellia lanceoleosa]